MSKGDLHKASGLSSSTMTKLRKGEDVSMEAHRKFAFASAVISGTLWSL
ncbi:MAG: helix-turn-helix domain-containing protein [Christensenellales bacterium]